VVQGAVALFTSVCKSVQMVGSSITKGTNHRLPKRHGC